MLALGEPDPDADVEAADRSAGATAELRVIGGPDAGGVHRLHGRQIRVGRSSEADVPLDDPDVSRLHLALRLGAEGEVTVRDLGSTNGSTLDGRLLTGEEQPLPEGALLRLGESTLALAGPDRPGEGRATRPDGLGHLQLAAPPRPGRPAPAEPELPEPAAAGGAGRTRSLLSRRLGRGTAAPVQAEGAKEHDRARTRQAADQRRRWPDPATLLLSALGPGPRLWERTPTHPDTLTLRLGTADLPGGPGTAPGTVLPAVPVTVDLRAAGSLGLAGPRERLAGLARAVLAQLAALHPPSALSLVVVSADGQQSAEERTDAWAWSLWLPHLRPGQGQDCRLLIGLDQPQAEDRLAELCARLADEVPLPPTVLLVDGDPGSDQAREWLELLLHSGPAAGVFPVCLAERPELLPAGLGATATITGEVGTQLTVDRPAPSRAEGSAGGGVPAPGTSARRRATSGRTAWRTSRSTPCRRPGPSGWRGRWLRCGRPRRSPVVRCRTRCGCSTCFSWTPSPPPSSPPAGTTCPPPPARRPPCSAPPATTSAPSTWPPPSRAATSICSWAGRAARARPSCCAPWSPRSRSASAPTGWASC